MATVSYDAFVTGEESTPVTGTSKGRKMHRIQEVRRREGMSLRSAARHLGYDMRKVREQEQESNDLKISDLQRWQEALDVPIAELLVESDQALSGPVLERARMVRLMKTAAAIRERAGNHPVSRLAQMLVEQLLELMPELQDVGPWHSVGQRRSLNEYGRAAELGLALVSVGSSVGDE
jgi:transcriptional regulator with XRE-family HTH domain